MKSATVATSADNASERARPTERRRLGRLVAATVAIVLVAELTARLIDPALPEPLVFYDAVAQVKDHQLDRLAQAGGADIVIVGNSMALFAVAPNELEAQLGEAGSPATVYNAGLTAGVPAVAGDYLERFVIDRARPQVVVWLLSTADLNEGFPDQAFARYEESIVVREDVWAGLDRTGSDLSSLIRNRRLLRDPKTYLDWLRGRDGEVERTASVITDSGEMTLQNLPRNRAAQQQVRDALANFSLGGTTARLVTRTIEDLRERGITVVLAEGTVPNDTVRFHPNGARDLRAFQEELARIGSETGSPIVALPDDLRADRLYQDYSHMNTRGGRRYTAHLGAELSRLGLIR